MRNRDVALQQQSVHFAVNLKRSPPTGRILLDGSVLTCQQARDLARRLVAACDRVDAVVGAVHREP